MASRRLLLPQVIAYWFTSASIARFAASLSAAGAGKFGKPCARLMPLCTALRRVISRMTDSVKFSVRAARTRLAVRATRDAPLIARVPLHAIEERLPRLVAANVLDEEREGTLAH